MNIGESTQTLRAGLHGGRRWLRGLWILGLWLCAGVTSASAANLRIATAFDPQTMDPHAVALLYHSRVAFQIYDSLLNRDEQFRLEPSLALSWSALNATTWRFKLRPGVTFHDGSAFTADDAVFSIERAMAPPSQRAFQLKGVTGARKVDELTMRCSRSSGRWHRHRSAPSSSKVSPVRARSTN